MVVTKETAMSAEAEDEKRGGMKTYSLRLSEDLYAKLEALAKREFRSVNSFIVNVLDREVAKRDRDEEAKGNQSAEVVGRWAA